MKINYQKRQVGVEDRGKKIVITILDPIKLAIDRVKIKTKKS